MQGIYTFTVADPRTFDGDPFEVAERAVRQAEAVAQILEKCITAAYIMGRNAQMERDLISTGVCDAPSYEDSAEGRRFQSVKERASTIQSDLKLLSRAVAFNPKEPLTVEGNY